MEQKVTGQGTRLSDVNPWDSYSKEMEVVMDDELAAAVAEYSERRYEESTSNQNKEELARQLEINTEIAKEYQWLTPEEYEDLEARIGRVMTHAEFITLLRKAGVCCHYRQHVHIDKVDLYYSKDGLAEAEVACWVQRGYMPELSIMNFDRYGVPLAERRRGWRTPLLQLILKGIITEEKANAIFGKPRESEQFHRYNSTIYAFRQAGSRLE